MHSRKTRPKLSILDGIMDAVSNGLILKSFLEKSMRISI